ncbi:hypothetical protein DID88_000034 [Monilinia fructigena]|uniref:Thioredoxin domain-containing protein n=1 Tax=Monilinia fructigena TaxID=38457 RepID=A0A395IK60_9HELO|nr:hypothetical protein DID88_000034 [Monilinia fructigena]
MPPSKRIPLPLPKPSRPISLPFSRIFPKTRQFTSTPKSQDQNRIYTPVRYPADLATYISTSTSTSKPLLTLWTTSYCSSCKTISPLMRKIIEEGVGRRRAACCSPRWSTMRAGCDGGGIGVEVFGSERADVGGVLEGGGDGWGNGSGNGGEIGRCGYSEVGEGRAGGVG